MNQYPYFIYAQKPQSDVNSQNAEGDFVEGTPTEWFFLGNCRDEVNTSGKRIALANGENYQYNAIIYAPKNTQILLENTKVLVSKIKIDDFSQINDTDYINTLRQNGDLRIMSSIKGYSKSQINVRLWV